MLKYYFIATSFQKISCVSEPTDYEQYLIRNKASIMSDPHRDLVLFPPDEVKVCFFTFLSFYAWLNTTRVSLGWLVNDA